MVSDNAVHDRFGDGSAFGVRGACVVSVNPCAYYCYPEGRVFIDVAAAPYKGVDARHGDCYVLDPDAWNRGKRVVIGVIRAKNPPIKRPPKRAASPFKPMGTRRVVVWDYGRAFDFRLVDVPVRPSEPVWAPRARELRAAGWSYRKIAKELGVSTFPITQYCMNTQ